jgi:integrase
MARLNDTSLRGLKTRDKSYIVTDGDGLYIEVLSNGKKYWRYRTEKTDKTTGQRKHHRFSLGEYPMVSLAEARAKRDEMKKAVKEDRLDELNKASASKVLFGDIALRWCQLQEDRSKGKERGKYITRGRLENYLMPTLRDRPMEDISPADLLDIIEEIERNGTRETAYRVYLILKKVFDYAVARELIIKDPARIIKDQVSSMPKTNRATLERGEEIGKMLRDIETYKSFVVRCAIQLQAFTFVRPVELRLAEWQEIDLKKAEWRIPQGKMKERRFHLVPLSRQAVEIFTELYKRTGYGRYCFPAIDAPAGDATMSESTALSALRSLGYTKEQMCMHGFRAMASTILNEHEWNPDAVEMQLAHYTKNTVRASYNHAKLLGIRKNMMQWYADYLDSLKYGTEPPEM